MSTPIIKTVNVNATIPIRNITPPMYGKYTNIKMTVSDILKCLCRRAIVEEVLSDGTTVRLNMKNFRDDHSHLVKDAEREVELIPTCPEHPDGCIDHVDFLKDMDADAEDDDTHEPDEDDSLESKVEEEDKKLETSGYVVTDADTTPDVAAAVTATTEEAEVSLASEEQPAKKTTKKKSSKKSSKK